MAIQAKIQVDAPPERVFDVLADITGHGTWANQKAGLQVTPVPLWHGSAPILGFRFGSFAYLTDCSGIPDASWPLVAGVETLVIDALRDKKHTTHFTVAEAVEAIARVGPRRAYLTHMSHDLGHVQTNARLPQGVELAYDGLSLDVHVDAS